MDVKTEVPSNRDSEISVISTILVSPGSIAKVIDSLKPEDFYFPSNRMVYRLACELFKEGVDIDVSTINSRLSQRKLEAQEEADIRSHIVDLIDMFVSTATLDYHVQQVKSKARMRLLLKFSMNLPQVIEDEIDDKRVADEAYNQITKIANDLIPEKMPDIKAIGQSFMSDLLYRMTHQKELPGIPSGLMDLDEMTGGFQKGNLITLAARPGMGKTALAGCISYFIAAKLRRPVVFFSLEMSAEEIYGRVISHITGINSYDIRRGYTNDYQCELIDKAMKELIDSPFYLIDNRANVKTVMDMEAKIRRMVLSGIVPSVIVVDHLQFIEGNTSLNNAVQIIAEITRKLKLLAGTLNVPILLLSQLSRAVETRKDKRPMLSDLRDSGTIEQDSDLVMFIYRDHYYSQESSNRNIADLIISKHRNGPTGTIQLTYQATTTSFSNSSSASISAFVEPEPVLNSEPTQLKVNFWTEERADGQVVFVSNESDRLRLPVWTKETCRKRINGVIDESKEEMNKFWANAAQWVGEPIDEMEAAWRVACFNAMEQVWNDMIAAKNAETAFNVFDLYKEEGNGNGKTSTANHAEDDVEVGHDMRGGGTDALGLNTGSVETLYSKL